MKKPYVTPCMEQLQIDTEHPLAMSVNNRKGSGEQLSREWYEIDPEDLLVISVLM